MTIMCHFDFFYCVFNPYFHFICVNESSIVTYCSSFLFRILLPLTRPVRAAQRNAGVIQGTGQLTSHRAEGVAHVGPLFPGMPPLTCFLPQPRT